ncbi:MAG: hypothetical protein ACRBN8_16330 [Nannocystales bacterium]
MDSRGLACLLGATFVVGACTTDVEDPTVFTTGAGSSSTSTESADGPTTASSTSASGSSTTSTTTSTTDATESTSTGSDSSSGGFSDGAQCGNGEIEGDEDCDCGDDGECTEAELGGISCESTEDPLVPGILTGGPLGCNMASCRYDTSQCVYCGDGELNGNEVCELDMPIETTCAKLGKGTAGKLSCMDTCQVDTTACTECGYQFDFEGEDGCSWDTLRTTGAAEVQSWECGTPGAFADGPGSAKTGVWGTNLNGNYSSNESGYVRSDNLDLSNCGDQTVTMTIRHWFQFEGSISNNDGGIVQVTTGDPDQLVDGWVTIEPLEGGVVYLPNVNASFPPVDGNPAFSGNDNENEGMWVESIFDVTEYAGPNLHIRFVIGSDGGNERAGWYIDNVEILGSGGA